MVKMRGKVCSGKLEYMVCEFSRTYKTHGRACVKLNAIDLILSFQ